MKNQKTLLKGLNTFNVFQLATELDKGQSTTNPFILCKRALASGNSVDLDTLNSILAFNNITITQAEFDYLLGIKATVLPKFPFPVNDESVISVIGSATNKGKANPKCGVYLIESLDGIDKYVGSSVNLAMRLRYYYSKKGLSEGRPVAKALQSKGVDKFNVSVYLLVPSEVEELDTFTSMENLTLAFEQLMILQVKPTLNALTVVNGALSVHSTYKQVGNPVFIYNSSKDTLLYSAESGTQMGAELGVKIHSMNRSIKSGKPMYGKYVFSRVPIECGSISLMSLESLRKDLDWCYDNRAQLRDFSKPANNMTPVILTDLLNNKTYTFISKRKACLFTQSFSVERHVNQLEVIKYKLPFTHKNWRFEANSDNSNTRLLLIFCIRFKHEYGLKGAVKENL
jgi:hypothetical protein